MNREEWDARLLAFWQHEPLDDKEREEILHWLQESEPHRNYYRQLQQSYLRQRWVMREPLIRRKEERRYRLVARRRRMLWRWTVAAASVCLLMAVGIGIYDRVQPGQVVPVAVNTEIEPGSAKAKLYLSSGEEVVLSKEPLSLTERHTFIDVDGEGAVAYRKGTEPSPEQGIYNRLVVERGGEYKIILSDGSEVWVNSGTVLEYPVVFSGNRRMVKLKGEAYFKVQADSSRPFIVVVADGMEVSAFGTEFNVNTYAERFVESVLVEGKISVGKEEGRVTLRPAQLAVYDRETGRMEVKDVDVRKYIDWKSGEFIFSDDCLEEVMKKITLWYDCEVVFTDRSLKDMRLSGNMRRYDSVEKFLHYLEITTGAKFVVKGRTIFVEK